MRSETKSYLSPRYPLWIPTHNEVNVITKRIDSLLALDYPQGKNADHLVDDSSDSTPGVIDHYMENHSHIDLARFEE